MVCWSPALAKEQWNVIVTGPRLHLTVHSMEIMTKEGPGIDYELGVVG